MVSPVLTPEEMAAVDASADVPVSELIERAGWAVARAARQMMGGTYGRSVTVIAGKGNNGADGRVAARLLSASGVRCVVVDPGKPVGAADLVIDAAFGTGLRSSWDCPIQPEAPVLAVDVPSGVDALTGSDLGSLRASRTVSFAALKPGLLLQPGRSRCGVVEVADIGLDVGEVSAWLVEDADVLSVIGRRAVENHKWSKAVRVVAGAPGMSGAGWLAAAGAQRAGAGMVAISTPGLHADDVHAPVEAVARSLPTQGWAQEVLKDLDRFDALVIGPGLGSEPAVIAEAAALIRSSPVPVLLDADGLRALERDPRLAHGAPAPIVITPHDGEYARLAGHAVGADRPAAARSLAASLGVVVLLKGATTIVSSPDGSTYYAAAGTPRLATAGSGDVLAGVAATVLDGAALAPSVAAAAHWHGVAGACGVDGLVASDLPGLLTTARAAMESP